MKKFLFLIISLFLITPTFARNNVSNIDIDVCISDIGRATITQTWTGTFDEGTEVYLPIEDKSIIVRDFTVVKDGYTFVNSSNWNVNASFEQKKGRCGIVRTDTGYELCFGITTYGENTYTFSYTIDPLVKSYKDADAFNFQFVNPGMSIFPSALTLKIRCENGYSLNNDIAKIWGFGFEGDTAFIEGNAVAYSVRKLQGDEYCNIMMTFNKGIFSPNVVIDDTTDTLIETAMEGSSYGETLGAEEEFDRILLIAKIIMLIVIIFFVIKFILFIKRIVDLKGFYKQVPYFRDKPNGGNIAVSHVLFETFDLWSSNDSNVIGALIIKMINDGNLDPIETKTVGFFGIEKKNTDLKLKKEPDDPLCKKLYDIIKNAAGDDHILQEKELKIYDKENYNDLNNLFDTIRNAGESNLNRTHSYKKILGKRLEDLSDNGKKELAEVYGLRKFLDEFTLLGERELSESIIWEDLMVYATLFGLAKKVIKNLQKIYPERQVEIESYATTIYISDIYFRALYFSSVNARQAMQAAKAASMAAHGLGGMTSIGGGGGFSGGGMGGGTR